VRTMGRAANRQRFGSQAVTTFNPAPEGRPRLAQRFSAGNGEKPKKSRRDDRIRAQNLNVWD